jgi:nucleotide-binding universal stress UspA family protein
MDRESVVNDNGIHGILHPTDLSEGCDRVYTHAVKVAALSGAALSVLHVHHDPDEPVNWQRLPAPGELLGAWGCRDLVLDEKRLTVVQRGVELGVVQGILDVWPNFLVVGPHGRQGITRLLEKSVAEAVSRREVGQIAEGLRLLTEAQVAVDDTENRFNEPGIYRASQVRCC